MPKELYCAGQPFGSSPIALSHLSPYPKIHPTAGPIEMSNRPEWNQPDKDTHRVRLGVE